MTKITNKQLQQLISQDFDTGKYGRNIAKMLSDNGYELDLTLINFKGANLPNCDWSGINFSGVDFTGADLRNGKFVGCNFTGCNLESAAMGNEILRNAVNYLKSFIWNKNTLPANFNKSDFTDANFSSVNLKNATFDCARIKGVKFEHADLTGVDFQFTDFQDIDCDGAICVGTWFYGAKFNNVSFRSADLTGAHFVREYDKKNLERPEFYKADFTDAKLCRINFQNLSLRGAILTRADVTDSQFYHTTLRDEDLPLRKAYDDKFSWRDKLRDEQEQREWEEEYNRKQSSSGNIYH